MARRKEPKIPDALLDQLLAGADPKTGVCVAEPRLLRASHIKPWARAKCDTDAERALSCHTMPNGTEGTRTSFSSTSTTLCATSSSVAGAKVVACAGAASTITGENPQIAALTSRRAARRHL